MRETAAPSVVFVDSLAKARKIAQSASGYDQVVIYVTALGRFYYPDNTNEAGMSEFTSKILQTGHTSDAEMVFAYTDDAALRCLAMRGDERRLNKRDCVGLSLRDLDDAVALPRIRAIEEAIASGKPTTFYYSHYWRGLDWHFKGVATHYPEQHEIIVELWDVEPWQTEWWLQQAR